MYRRSFASSLLFLLYYINSISSAVNQISLRLFVDDTKLFIIGYRANETLLIATEKLEPTMCGSDTINSR